METISREKRIKLRAEQYAKGNIDLDTFVSLERLDEMPEVEAEIVPSPIESNTAQQPKPSKKKNKTLDITREEYDKLSLYEQQQLYNEHPDEIEALVKTDGR